MELIDALLVEVYPLVGTRFERVVGRERERSQEMERELEEEVELEEWDEEEGEHEEHERIRQEMEENERRMNHAGYQAMIEGKRCSRVDRRLQDFIKYPTEHLEEMRRGIDEMMTVFHREQATRRGVVEGDPMRMLSELVGGDENFTRMIQLQHNFVSNESRSELNGMLVNYRAFLTMERVYALVEQGHAEEQVLDTIRGGYRVLGIMYDDYIIMKF